MHALDEFAEILEYNAPLASITHLRIGGAAEILVQPRSREELAAVVRRCTEQGLRMRILGDGSNILVPDEGVKGVILRLGSPAFCTIAVEENRVLTGAGASLSDLIAEATRHRLGGLELLVGIPGSVGGALRCNAGDRIADVSQAVRRVEVMDGRGAIQWRDRDELRFGEGSSNLDDPVIIAAEFELEPDDPDAIVKRMRKAWIHRSATQPLGYQSAARIFRNPRGLTVKSLIEQLGLARTRVGGAEISERDPGYVVAHPGATSQDVLRLIELVRSRVRERFGLELELQIAIW